MDQFSGSGIGVLIAFFGARCFFDLPIPGTSAERCAILFFTEYLGSLRFVENNLH